MITPNDPRPAVQPVVASETAEAPDVEGSDTQQGRAQVYDLARRTHPLKTPLLLDSKPPTDDDLKSASWRDFPVISVVILVCCLGAMAAVVIGDISGGWLPVCALLIFVGFAASVGTLEITPALLSRKKPATSDDKFDRYKWALNAGVPTLEAGLAGVAAAAAHQITQYRAWNSEWLDTHRIRMNPAEELMQIVDGLHQLHDVRGGRGAEPDPRVLGGHPRRVFDRQTAELDTIQDGIADRIAALRIYLVRLDDLGRLLEAQETMDRAVSVDAQIAEMVGRSAQDQMATDGLTGLSTELVTVTEALRSAIALLSGSVELPASSTNP